MNTISGGAARPARVLVVDDELKNQKLLLVMLAPEGYVVATAGSGAEALAAVALERPDLILLDVMMPVMDGFELATRLKADPATRNIPIIMVTVRDDREAKMRGLLAGAEDFLSKPVDRAELKARVRNLLRLKAYGDYHDEYSQLLEREVASRTAHLLESEARYRRIVETTNEGVWVIGARGETSFMNARMGVMLGCDPNEAVGRPSDEFLFEDGRASMANDMELFEAGRSKQVELRLRRSDGATLWTLLETSPIFDPDGQLEGVLAMVMDISERRVAEEALRASESRFRGLWDSGLVLITISDALGKVCDVNEAGAQMLGYSRDELLSGEVHWPDLTPPEWRHADELAAGQLTAQGVAAPFEKELLRKDGSRLPILTGAATLVGRDGIAIAIDLTERKIAENANLERMAVAQLSGEVGVALTQGGSLPEVLRRCAEALVAYAGAACVRIWTLNPRTKDLELQASAGLEDYGGAEGLVRIGVHETRLVAEQRAPHVTSDVLGDPRTLDPGWAKREGLVAFASHPLLVSGELVGVIASFARKPWTQPALEGLASVSDEIAIGVHRSIGESIRVTLEGQLRQAQKMEAVGRLAGGVAHDFNNVLSVILSYAELMLDTLSPDDPMRDDVDEIQKAGNRAADLTRQLLMFSRKQVLAPKVIDLNDLLAKMDKMLQRILGEDIELRFVAGERLGRLRADPSSIEQVVMNLVVNARDAMPTGGKLTIETSNVELDEDFAREHVDLKAGPYVVLAVTDTGVGIDALMQTRIFEPFFTTKAVDKGTGLGLSTVFGIAQQSGGGVWVHSEPGRGATFVVYLPRVDLEIDRMRAIAARPVRPGSETILLVDDDEQVRLVARGILRRSGYRVIDAKHAGEALLHCEQHLGTIDLLLTDVVMPQMSGPDLAKRLAKTRPGMKVVCMSGHADDSVVRHGFVDMGISYLQKPITPETLRRKVREVLDA
ncbi:MAG: domain S-box protein [Labilithrix sp.]|nr:domain S-box protein [Labilithrix sp.]